MFCPDTIGYGELAAEAYDLDKSVGRSFGDVEFYRANLMNHGGPVLEAGVGNGRVLVPLTRAGLSVAGFDASPQMLACCQRNLARHGLSASVWQDRFETFAAPPGQGAVILPAGTFQLITSDASVSAFLGRSHKVLKPGGLLIFDLDSPAELSAPEPRTRVWTCPDGGTITLTETPSGIDQARRVVRFSHAYHRSGGAREPLSQHEDFALRWWTIGEMVARLNAEGFRCREIIAGYGDRCRAADGITVLATAC